MMETSAAARRSSMIELKGKVAVVTGASEGIGAAIAKGLGAAGASVVVNYSFSKEGADRVVADIKANGGNAIAVKGDVAKGGRHAPAVCRNQKGLRHARRACECWRLQVPSAGRDYR